MRQDVASTLGAMASAPTSRSVANCSTVALINCSTNKRAVGHTIASDSELSPIGTAVQIVSDSKKIRLEYLATTVWIPYSTTIITLYRRALCRKRPKKSTQFLPNFLRSILPLSLLSLLVNLPCAPWIAFLRSGPVETAFKAVSVYRQKPGNEGLTP